eukprot:3841172-Rhodomonas_salina.3
MVVSTFTRRAIPPAALQSQLSSSDRVPQRQEGEEGKRLSMATPSSAPVLDVQCLAGTMYAGCRDGRARAWLADQDKPICTYIAHNAPIQALLLDEEARMYTGSDDNSIRVWDLKVPKRVVDTESCVYVFEGHTDGVLCLAKGESLLYSGGYDHTIRIWDAKAVDRAVIPGLIECGIPLHRLNAMAESGPVVLGNETAEKASDPDWWSVTALVPLAHLRQDLHQDVGLLERGCAGKAPSMCLEAGISTLGSVCGWMSSCSPQPSSKSLRYWRMMNCAIRLVDADADADAAGMMSRMQDS